MFKNLPLLKGCHPALGDWNIGNRGELSPSFFCLHCSLLSRLIPHRRMPISHCGCRFFAGECLITYSSPGLSIPRRRTTTQSSSEKADFSPAKTNFSQKYLVVPPMLPLGQSEAFYHRSALIRKLKRTLETVFLLMPIIKIKDTFSGMTNFLPAVLVIGTEPHSLWCIPRLKVDTA